MSETPRPLAANGTVTADYEAQDKAVSDKLKDGAATASETVKQQAQNVTPSTRPAQLAMASMALAAVPLFAKMLRNRRSSVKQIKVAEVMTRRAVVVNAAETVLQAAKKLERNNVGSAPICDGNRLRGMITDRDIVTKVIAKGKDPATVRASELAEGTPHVIGADEPLERAMQKMSKYDVRRLPVIDRNKRLVGMLAQADIAEALGAEETGRLVENISAAPANN